MKKAFLLITIQFCFEFVNAQSQAGILDSSFGTNGVVAAFPQGGDGSIVIQPDGKIVVGGTTYDGPDFSVVRYNSAGSVDYGFGANGIATAEIGLGYNSARDLALQPDGKILFAGSCVDFNGKWSFALIRFNSNGTLDNSFSGDGKLITSFNDFSYADYGEAVAVQPDGKIIEVGLAQDNSANQGFGIVRFNVDGSLDNTFGNGGKLVIPIGNAYPEATAVIVQPDLKILVGGYSWSNNQIPSSFALMRLNSDGTLDLGFGTSGKDTAYFGGAGSSGDLFESSTGKSIALQTDGKIVMTGSQFLGYNTWTSLPLVRYNADGALDNTFGNGGKVVIANDSFGYGASDIALQQDGKILVGGSGSLGHYMLVRFNTNGKLDSLFGDNGEIFITIDEVNSFAESIALQQDGKILLAGGDKFIVARFLSGLNVGILNIKLSDAPILIYPNPIKSNATLEYTLTENENLTVSLIDLQGRQLQTFIINQDRTTGEHKEELCFDDALPAGNYVLQISNGVHQQSIKIILAR